MHVCLVRVSEALELCIYIYACNIISEKRDHEFKREKGRLYGSVGRKEMEQRNGIILE